MAQARPTRGRTARAADKIPPVGAHMSTAGGAWKAFARAVEVGADCMAVFVKSNVQWHTPGVSDEDVSRFEAERAGHPSVGTVVAHCSYLVNVATSDPDKRAMSLKSLDAELAICARYGLPWLVLHPGGHMGDGPKAGVAAAARAIRGALSRVDRSVGILIETTAGAGTALGRRFEELAEILAKTRSRRVGICLDTSHVFVAGYDIATDEGYAAAKERLRALGLLDRLRVIHCNDSTGALGSRYDRHAHIGKGQLGRHAFELIMRDADLAGIPRILETPKGRCGRRDCDAVNISLLRRLARGAPRRG